MLRILGVAALLAALAAWLWPGLVAAWAYSTGSITVPGSYRVISPPASPNAIRPLVYCTASSPSVRRNRLGTIATTCYNGTNHTVTASVSYRVVTACSTCPALVGSPHTYTMAANGSAAYSINVFVPNGTTVGTYIIGYNLTTPSAPPVDVSFGFTSTVTVI